MKNECSIIRDLLPLYAEHMVSRDTADFVENHLKDCEACRKEFQQIKEPPRQTAEPDPVKKEEAAPLLKLRRKLKLKKIQTAALTVVFMMALFLSAFAVLDAPVYFPYSEGLVTVSPGKDGSMRITFDEKVTDFDYTLYEDPDGGDFLYCEIQAWTSLWDQWFSEGEGKLSAEVTPEDSRPVLAVYAPNDGSENVFIAEYDPVGQIHTDSDANYPSVTVLPRLAFGYYLILAAAALAVSIIAWFLTRKKPVLHLWTERIGLYPVAYLISFFIVSGFSTMTYSLQRDFFLIIFLSLLLYIALLLAHSIWRLRKEIKEING